MTNLHFRNIALTAAEKMDWKEARPKRGRPVREWGYKGAISVESD